MHCSCSPGWVRVTHCVEDLPIIEVVIGETLAEEQLPEQALQVVIVWSIVESQALHMFEEATELLFACSIEDTM